MTPMMRGLCKLFSRTPAFKSNSRLKLLFPLTGSVYPRTLAIVSRALVLLLILNLIELNVLGLAFLLCSVLIFARDFLQFKISESLSSIGYDNGFFVVDDAQTRIALEIHGDVFVNQWLVAVSFKSIGSGSQYSCLFGSWNMAKADFHALRQLLLSL